MTFLKAFALSMALTSTVGADLIQYVGADDGAYEWEIVSQTDLGGGAILYELRLVSQVWRGITWQHTLRIIKPKYVKKSPSLVLLLITGSGGGEEELSYGTLIANRTGAPAAILYDVPNQPLFGGLSEDDLIAETFVKYIETRDNTWPLLLPMVKSAIKAMDAVEEFAESELSVRASGFLVAGASKRGWTTWLTPAVDGRVKAISPMVYDNLDLPKQMKHQIEVWGKFSENISEYTDRDIPQRLLSGEDVATELSEIVDPFAYRDRITVPKLIIIGTNDRYWPLDALNIYYDGLMGEKYILYVPNAGHGLEGGMDRVIGDIIAFFLKADGRLKFPKLAWESKEEDGTIELALSSDIKPQVVRAWVAKSQTGDFRDAIWEEFEMKQENQTYIYELEKPAGNYVAIFGEAVYYEDGVRFFLSTNVSIFSNK
ncbi:MAG: PhoPQ-activated pathogenicity-related family protein [bacterium]